MIVIMIIGLVYTLAIVKLQDVSDEKIEPSFLNLKEYLGSFLADGGKSVRFLCLDDCDECTVYVDGVEIQSMESFFDASVERYRYDFLLGAQRIENPAYFNADEVQKDVCFSLNVSKNGISEQVFIAYDEKVYDYTTYFGQTRVYDSLEAVVEEKERIRQEVMQ